MNNIEKVNDCYKNPPKYALIQQLLQPQTIDDHDKIIIFIALNQDHHP
jgi:hypothetical protein